MSDGGAAPHRQLPTKRQAAVFRFKSFLLQSRRFVTDTVGSTRTRRFAASDSCSDTGIAGFSNTKLWTVVDPRERYLNAGKIHNLRLAVERVSGLEIPAGEVFSFWKHVGRITKRRGFVAGRELREGCIIPNIGGGLCQLSNALYNAALDANFEIVERHPHTQAIPGSHAVHGRDATVFWNYLDLRFRSAHPFRIEAELTAEELRLRFIGNKSSGVVLHQIQKANSPSHLNNCASCGEDDCFRSVKVSEPVRFGKTAFLVDEYSTEFDNYIAENRSKEDVFLLPLDGRRLKKSNYAWTREGFSASQQSVYVTALRSVKSRRLAKQGAERQRNLLAMYERLAADYASKLTYDVLHVVVDQHLLPFLWRGGHLGGRTFDVLTSTLPMKELQNRLDEAYRLHPGSKTLGDFRADENLIKAESAALARATRIITSHTGIAKLFPGRVLLLEWEAPAARLVRTKNKGRRRVLFPASTLGRKGCYELREAIRDLEVDLMITGANIEAEDFWNGVNVIPPEPESADIVVLPAFVEHAPRRLLRYTSAGIPVIATEACGIEGIPGVTTVAAGDAADLRAKIIPSIT